ncbi:aldose epimerase family protein [Flavobacterium sp. K5-23]|uniref:aldose epimerase family protein n=1 Tax=Flavobacterium sp. K5-23 TaxID=2746225 RepID=UPI00200BEAAE|nr:aldose epimerase family protein [Flavobacterium sp. K5-23]UQD55489.1 galactose mutarotase [Flavobacterium sp. K5-23]
MSKFIEDSKGDLFGILPNGTAIYSYELTNKNGLRLTIINYGATVTSLKLPLNKSDTIDVVLGFDNLEDYVKSFDLENAPYLGATVGRFAGRINKGRFNLNGKSYHLNTNNNSHSLHGGNIGFSQKVWEVKTVTKGENPSITLAYFSPNQEENYPGDLSVELKYTLSDENELILEYKATASEDTIVNLTHHSYFNLEGHKAVISDQEIVVNAQQFLEINDENIFTGRFLNVLNSTSDFSFPDKCPSNIDRTFVLNKEKRVAASLFSVKNNLKMVVITNQPTVHVYVGGDTADIGGKDGAQYHSLSGICFETQNFPNATNHPHFPSSILKKEEIYQHLTTYKFELS